MGLNREDILSKHWEYWKQRMINKYGEDHNLITETNCIEDWLFVNKVRGVYENKSRETTSPQENA